jgi:hypothetical protein
LKQYAQQLGEEKHEKDIPKPKKIDSNYARKRNQVDIAMDISRSSSFLSIFRAM